MPEDHASSADPPIVRGAVAPPGEVSAAVRHVHVLLPLPLPAALDYLVPEGVPPLEPGSFVRVPLGARSLVGVVWEGVEGEPTVERLKPVAEALPIPRLQPELRRFVERVAAYTMAPPGMVLRMTMSVAAALEAPRARRVCGLSPAGLAALCSAVPVKRLTPTRQRVLEALRNGMPLQPAELARAAG
jgi:primosomal protein N' (replication factor Y)